MRTKQSHAYLCAVALINCCVRITLALSPEDVRRAEFETLLWEHARKALEN
jgi:hypothetical protein